jgi:hypothetical protein
MRTICSACNSFRGQAGRWFSGQGQYTLSRFNNNTGGVLNRTNFTSYIGSLSSPLFSHPSAALADRQLQFSLGYRF